MGRCHIRHICFSTHPSRSPDGPGPTHTVWGVGTTGVIFAAIAIAWLAYLVPHFVRRRDDEPAEESTPADRFSESMRIVRHGTAPLLDQDMAEIQTYEVSTPQTRRAAVNDLRRLEEVAAGRRRRVLLVLLAALSVVIGLGAVELVPWWAVAVPGGLLVVFFVVARVSVRFMLKSLDARYRDICQGSDEATVFLSRKEVRPVDGAVASVGSKVEPAAKSVLWEPVPITMPTYVSKPLAPRTVRTIDLSGPSVSPTVRPQTPVTADAQHPVAPARADADGDDSREAASA